MKDKIEILAYFLFCIANVLLLINPGVFWDDWTLYNMDDKGIMSQFYGNGAIIIGYLHILLKNIWNSPLLYHLLTFLLQLLSIFLLFRIHGKFRMRKEISLFFLFTILIYAVFPIYDSKINMIVLPYTFCLTFFLVAFLFLLKYFENPKKVGFRVLSLVFFFTSFFTNSLVFFYLIPIFLVFFFPYLNKFFHSKSTLIISTLVKNAFRQVLTHFDFFLLPFLFWTIRSIYFQPSQQYAALGYNEVNIGTLLEIPYRFLLFVYLFLVSLVPLIKEALKTPEIWMIFLAVAYVSYKRFLKNDFNFSINWKIMVSGLLTLFVGVFPYLMVNKIPSYTDYSSRHQLLIGYGICIVFTGLLFLLKSAKLKKVLFSFSIGIFVSFTIFLHFSFFKGYIKQVVYQNYFVTSLPKSQDSKIILLIDKTSDFSKKGNPNRFYAFAGMLKINKLPENTMIIRASDLERYKKRDLLSKISPYLYQYNLSQYNYTEPEFILKVNYSEVNRPVLPLFSYYIDFISGNEEKWPQYFTFNLKPILANSISIY